MGRVYDLRVWRDQIQPSVLAEEPLCRMCTDEGHVTPAEIVDHILPVHARPDLAFERSNLQPLCSAHHSHRKQQQERRSYHTDVDEHGYPLDPAHPANRGRVASKHPEPDDQRRSLFLTEPALEAPGGP